MRYASQQLGVTVQRALGTIRCPCVNSGVLSVLSAVYTDLCWLRVLCLLQRGGRVSYFGPLGVHSRALVDYLESVPGGCLCCGCMHTCAHSCM